jgi:Fe-S-cluster-containing dehydrogenase component
MRKLSLKCPQCGRDINFTRSLDEWFEYTGEKQLSNEMYLSIYCDHCDDMTLCFFITPTSESETINSPALDDPVTLKKPKNF